MHTHTHTHTHNRVSKRIAPTDENDLNLNADLFLLYARLQVDLSNFDPNDPALLYHGGGPDNRRVVNTNAQINPVTAGGPFIVSCTSTVCMLQLCGDIQNFTC